MAQFDRMDGMQREVVEARMMRTYQDSYTGLPGVRKMWLFQGRVFMPVARSQLFAFTQTVNPTVFGKQWLVVRRDSGSIVYKTREIVSPYVLHVVDKVENAKATKTLVEGRFGRLQKLLATEQRVFEGELRQSSRKSLLRSLYIDGEKTVLQEDDGDDGECVPESSMFDYMISDDERCMLEDLTDQSGRVKHIPGQPVFGLTYSEDFYSKPQDINHKRMVEEWRRHCPNAPEGICDDA